MVKTFKAVCNYEDGTQDEAQVTITREGSNIFQVAWQISNGETGRSVVEESSFEKVFAGWCEENEFEPAN